MYGTHTYAKTHAHTLTNAHTHVHTQAIIFVYDVTRRETFEDIEAIWLKEVDM